MTIRNIQESKALQKYCAELNRQGMYKKAIEIAIAILNDDNTPQEVMMHVGEMKALAIGSKCEGYWNEKVEHGYHRFIDINCQHFN